MPEEQKPFFIYGLGETPEDGTPQIQITPETYKRLRELCMEQRAERRKKWIADNEAAYAAEEAAREKKRIEWELRQKINEQRREMNRIKREQEQERLRLVEQDQEKFWPVSVRQMAMFVLP